MATMQELVRDIRTLVRDRPEVARLNGAINATTEVVTVDAIDIGKIAVGQILEHDVGGELRYVYAVDQDANQFSAYRGYANTTAAAQADDSFLWINPRFTYSLISQTVESVIEIDLYSEGVWDLVEHTITSNADGSRDYPAPTANCMRFLDVYQFPSSMPEPRWLTATEFSAYPRNVNTTHYSTGKMFSIRHNFGAPGTDQYFVTCAHKLTLATLSARQEEIVRWLTCAYLLEAEDVARQGQNTLQGERTVRPGQRVQTAAYYRQLAEKAINDERSEIRRLTRTGRVWLRRGGVRFP